MSDGDRTADETLREENAMLKREVALAWVRVAACARAGIQVEWAPRLAGDLAGALVHDAQCLRQEIMTSRPEDARQETAKARSRPTTYTRDELRANPCLVASDKVWHALREGRVRCVPDSMPIRA
jgi:hypothetical protein